MNKETQSIIRNIQNVLHGEPWYGRSVFALLNEIDSHIVFKKPNPHAHSIAELLYHTITWAEFCLRQIEKADKNLIEEIQARDWRAIDPSLHTWEKGLEELKTIHEQIISALESKKDDEWLKEKVHFRNFNFRFMLNGLIQHDIYHIGQIAYTKKLLS